MYMFSLQGRIQSKATGNSRSGIPGNRVITKFPAGMNSREFYTINESVVLSYGWPAADGQRL